jgi:DNA-binding MarR family transcriptional regulator
MDREMTDRASKRMLQIMEFYHEQLFKEERMALIDINDVEFRLLFRLSTAPMLSMSTLGDLLLVSKSHVTKLVDALNDAGLVQRHANLQDRRVINISITEKGQKKLDFLKNRIQEQIKMLISNLQPGELEKICTSTEIFLEIVSKIR